MKYLFFDIECANCYNNCAKIFSLGYLVTDEKFRILHDKEDVLINPRDRFDWYVAKKMMAYPKSIFADKPPFPEFYDTFRELFEDPDTIVIGYAVTNDVHFLQDDCRRYGLAPFNYRFYDVQQIYARQPENNTAKNLEDSLLSWCGIEAENLHRSDEDAYNTMRILKAIAEYHGTDLAGILAQYPDCAGETRDGNMEYAWKKPEPEGGKKKRRRGRKKADGEEGTPEDDASNRMEKGSENAAHFLQFLREVRPKKTRRPPILSGHTVTVSLAYQRTHFNEMLYLVQMIVNAGGRYTLVTKEADTLYTYGDPTTDTRLAVVTQMQSEGKEIDVLPLKVLFDLLETSETKLSRKPKMTFGDEGAHVEIPAPLPKEVDTESRPGESSESGEEGSVSCAELSSPGEDADTPAGGEDRGEENAARAPAV